MYGVARDSFGKLFEVRKILVYARCRDGNKKCGVNCDIL